MRESRPPYAPSRHTTSWNSNSSWQPPRSSSVTEHPSTTSRRTASPSRLAYTWITPEAALRGEVQEREQLVDELGLDPTLPIVGLLTNVLWDAQLYYESQAFPDMLEWLWTTIDYFVEHPGLQLIVRIHPHEPGRASKLLSARPLFPVVRGAVRAFNAIAGGVGNKFTVQAVRG